MIVRNGPGFGDQVGVSAEGNPIYLYADRSGIVRHVVVLPDGRAVYSDPSGKIGYPVDGALSSATLGGVIGVLAGGPLAGMAGALLGVALNSLSKRPG